jgi:hypothetical protein
MSKLSLEAIPFQACACRELVLQKNTRYYTQQLFLTCKIVNNHFSMEMSIVKNVLTREQFEILN